MHESILAENEINFPLQELILFIKEKKKKKMLKREKKRWKCTETDFHVQNKFLYRAKWFLLKLAFYFFIIVSDVLLFENNLLYGLYDCSAS